MKFRITTRSVDNHSSLLGGTHVAISCAELQPLGVSGSDDRRFVSSIHPEYDPWSAEHSTELVGFIKDISINIQIFH